MVEYILLLSVITSLGYTFYNNKKFKEFLKGKDGMFATMKKGMSYSYRYGLEYKADVPFEEKMQFDYQTNKHDTYLNSKESTSRFFGGIQVYPKQ
ncbi:MAG: hypothetical protein ACXVLQ_07370 [Bacteriovorax sp.]